MHMYHLARTRHFDSILALELAAATEQVVILGAGLDSRAHRFITQLQDVPVYEVDHPHTSLWKRERVRAHLPEANPGVRYVAVDLARSGLFPALTEAGFRPERKTFFLWEGASMYLPGEAVRELLGSVTRSVPEVSIAFDYLYRSLFGAPERFAGGQRNLAVVRRGGEPYLFGIDPIDVGPLCISLGFEVVSNLDAGALATRYLHSTKHAGAARMLEFAGIVHAHSRPLDH